MKPAISILMSAYNSEAFIAEAIDGILRQTFEDWELLVADDGSTDKTREIINGYSDDRIIVSHNVSNQGKVATVNRLFEESRGRYVTIHDADDISIPERLERQNAFLTQNPSYALCGCDFIQLGSAVSKVVSMPTDYETIKSALPAISQFHGPTMLFRKDIVKEVGGLFRHFTWGEDIDFSARVVEKFLATNISEPLYRYRIHDQSLTNNIEILDESRLVNRELRVFLADQRRLNGVDCLMLDKPEELAEKEHQLLEELNLRKDIMYWDFSQRLHHLGLYESAAKAAAQAFRVKKNWRNLKNFLFMFKSKLTKSQ